MAVRFLLSSASKPPPLMQNPIANSHAKPLLSFVSRIPSGFCLDRREIVVSIVSLTAALALGVSPLDSLSEVTEPPPREPVLAGIANTKSWFQFYGDGFSIRVPPLFEDIMEPEEYNTGFSFYGDKAKPKTFAARFASQDRSEVLTVLIRPSNQLKITFLEAKDITDLGSLREAAKIFVPGGANLYSGRTIKIKEDESFRIYYFYEFGIDTQHVAMVACVDSGKAYVAGAAAPQDKWDDDGVMLRSAAISLSVL
ncbi:uncharacterized protein LOC121967217 isoform X1 [Zingiber officinale]|uniref:PsbP C-terminal domain-containing protein n=2 Tax=Zingiber officinale TaxID=94328 RepID=A0A8J5H343_ZINOF|nr:uncharacterized protein LOC121967217 isoform X1 [Zingiber officinale]KAG6518979.1 hypothetical protein ZIOFF_022466 [Zingiber officinale]